MASYSEQSGRLRQTSLNETRATILIPIGVDSGIRFVV
jgi:hypothetical protein